MKKLKNKKGLQFVFKSDFGSALFSASLRGRAGRRAGGGAGGRAGRQTGRQAGRQESVFYLGLKQPLHPGGGGSGGCNVTPPFLSSTLTKPDGTFLNTSGKP